MIYNPPEECEGFIMQVFLQIIAFSLQTDGSGRPVLPLEKAELDKKDNLEISSGAEKSSDSNIFVA